ncbi:hypothetical protein G7077_11300 [Sphingomonas piscis]|uniref:Uncharacterized protein n=1 Tax=Sphingomonas piscis TaxID=2714943 RepID=A0A6G7YRP4_9SPHN|nr:hypothetical protein [Sphingomonas piscis]QIK79401.1 hypothetical protein G7077_11300 [Sphingomonas piscis]
MMRAAAIAAAVTVAPPIAAQSSNQQMLEMAKTIRAQAEQLKSSLSPDDYQAMLDSAAQIEKDVKAGGFSAPAGQEVPSISKKISDEHNGRLEWLTAEEACVGFQWENWRTYAMTVGPALPGRNQRCKAAFAEYETYFKLARDGRGAEANRHLEAYERLAHEAVDYFNANKG